MDEAEILNKIRASLVARFGLEESQLGADVSLRELGADSMHILEIMLDLEAELGASLGDLSLPPNPTLGDVAGVIARNLPAKT